MLTGGSGEQAVLSSRNLETYIGVDNFNAVRRCGEQSEQKQTCCPEGPQQEPPHGGWTG